MTDRGKIPDDPEFREDDFREGDRVPMDGSRPGSGPLDHSPEDTDSLIPAAGQQGVPFGIGIGGNLGALAPRSAEEEQADDDDASMADATRRNPDQFELESVHHEEPPGSRED